MPGLGTAVNAAGIIAGGLIGTLLGKKINENIRSSILKVLGLSVMFLGAAGAFSRMLKIESDGSIKSSGTMIMIVSLVAGTFLGELLKIENRFESLGNRIKKKVRATDGGFTAAFVNTSLVVCVGAMAVVGAIEDGLTGNASTLFAKALLDFLIVIIISSSMGAGCIFAFIPVAVFQGTLTALAKFAQPLLSVGSVISDMSFIGSVMIFCIGVNLSFGKRFNVGNMLPALVIALLYSLISFYI